MNLKYAVKDVRRLSMCLMMLGFGPQVFVCTSKFWKMMIHIEESTMLLLRLDYARANSSVYADQNYINLIQILHQSED